MSDHVMSVMSVLALQPSSFHITGGCTEGGDVSKEICFICTMVLYFYLWVLVRVIQEAAYFLLQHTKRVCLCVFVG